ncbi:MAG TPA: tyrosine-type recombinase/integrase, partial [Xanthobacteraceae bacterium]|nr:tyrosine-type recombinase/integrase [Xanthobacteraceae bacterium]
PRPRPPHLHREITRHGRIAWYVRIGNGPRTRIHAEYGSPEFAAAYQAAIAGKAAPGPTKFNARTLGWLIVQYRDSIAWAKLSGATRRQRESILRAISRTAGNEPISRINTAAIEKGIDRRTNRPHAARHLLQTMRGMFQWAVKAKHAGNDPTKDLKTIRPPTDGHHVWTDEECATFEARWPRGTRERLAFDLLLYTGLRRGDAVRLGRPHVKNSIASIRTEKTGEVVTIPILPPLQASIDAGPIGELTFICGDHGRPMKKESFGNWFREVCKKADVPGSAHGLRKAGATRAANNGATEAQLEAIFGWRGGGMAALYTREANRVKLAREAATKLLTERDANIYSRTLASGAGKKSKKTTKSKT